MVSSLPGQSVGLWGQPSQVAACFSHSAGMEKPSSAGVTFCCALCLSIKSACKIVAPTRLSMLQSREVSPSLSTPNEDSSRGAEYVEIEACRNPYRSAHQSGSLVGGPLF